MLCGSGTGVELFSGWGAVVCGRSPSAFDRVPGSPSARSGRPKPGAGIVRALESASSIVVSGAGHQLPGVGMLVGALKAR